MIRVILASARLTRFVVADNLGRWLVKDPVDAAMDRYAEQHAEEPWWWKYREGLDCPFCAGFWLGLGVLAGEQVLGGNRAWRTITGALAMNYVVGHLVARLDGEE